MNEFLAELYGTQDNIAGEDDFEKQAAAEFLVKLAASEGVDLDTLSDDEVAGLLEEIEKDAAAETEPEINEEAQEKLAEADFLGRAMAHAYVDELTEIEKEAGRGVGSGGRIGPEEAEAFARQARPGAKVQRMAGQEAPEFGAKAMGRAQRAAKGRAAYEAAQTGGKSGAKGLLQRVKQYHRTGAQQIRSAFAKDSGKGTASLGKKVMERAGRFGRGAAKFAPHAAVAGLGAYGLAKALKGKEKKSFDEQFEDAAAMRAYELLGEAGYDVEKVAEADIDIRALQMLEEAGYPVQWEE